MLTLIVQMIPVFALLWVGLGTIKAGVELLRPSIFQQAGHRGEKAMATGLIAFGAYIMYQALAVLF